LWVQRKRRESRQNVFGFNAKGGASLERELLGVKIQREGETKVLISTTLGHPWGSGGAGKMGGGK